MYGRDYYYYYYYYYTCLIPHNINKRHISC